MTDGSGLCLLVMMDCILQALLTTSKCVNYSLTYLLLGQDFKRSLLKISFHLLLHENILKKG